MIVIAIWYVLGVIGAVIINNKINRTFDQVMTRGDLIFVLLMGLFGPTNIVVAVVFGIIDLIDRVCNFFEKDFWSKPLFKEKK